VSVQEKLFFFEVDFSFDALVQRYEPPIGQNRWDAPLFELKPEDELPLEQIADYLANKRPPPPNKSTVNVSLNINHVLRRLF
jgi:protein KTI12